MKILHISPTAPYNDNWGYQENLLPRYQKKLGHEVKIFATNYVQEGGFRKEIICSSYTLDDGVTVVRNNRKKIINDTITNVICYMPVYKKIVEFRPDFIFFHSLVSCTIFDAIKYKKKVNSHCVIVMDNHLDYNIGFKYNTCKLRIKRAWYRFIVNCSVKYIDKIYGVTPWRKEYAIDYFKVPVKKAGVLIMGGDDDKIHLEHRQEIRDRVRARLGVKEGEFLVVTGGKLDRKKRVIELMKAFDKISEKKVRLLIFGTVLDEIKDEFYKLSANKERFIYIGWIGADEVYDYYFASDLAVFPGQHSVLWEQACAAKIPCVFARWRGMEHVDNGGNSCFLEDISEQAIVEMIESLIFTNKYNKQREKAESSCTDIYLYSKIAQKSLECMKNR